MGNRDQEVAIGGVAIGTLVVEMGREKSRNL
jgi:hypothetical protein